MTSKLDNKSKEAQLREASQLTESLLLIAQAFFLPPKHALPTPDISVINKSIQEGHPWLAFNRSLSSLCTLRADTNNVFGVMLLPSRHDGQRASLQTWKESHFSAPKIGRKTPYYAPMSTCACRRSLQ